MIDSSSRYYPLPTLKYVSPAEREYAYKGRRFLPHAIQGSIVVEHAVTQGDRLDRITARHLGNPALFWQVCDANMALHPDELTAEVGRRLRIVLIQP